MKNLLPVSVILHLVTFLLFAQTDTTTVQSEIYNRPFLFSDKESSLAIGGYLEGNTNYFSEDGISEGFSMELRRFNIFLHSTISDGISFLSELEFEHGTEEIALETAQVDIEINPALVIRTGILLVPLGAYNQNHDSPKWDFVERPLVSTEIIPSTLSEIGFGLNGRLFFNALSLTYDAYLVNGLQDGIILNEAGRTFLQNGKAESRLEEDNNGSPAFTGRIAFSSYKWGEAGLSYYGGIYNSFQMDGEVVDDKRSLRIVAIDLNTRIKSLILNSEWAFTSLDVPSDIAEIYGEEQWGGYLELTYPVLRRSLLGFEKSILNASLRMERIDYNRGTFSSTGANIRDDISALGFSLAWRPGSSTVLRANYRSNWIYDAIGNPVVRSAGFQFGIATYF